MLSVRKGQNQYLMFQYGVKPNKVSFSSLMDGYCLRGQMDKACRLFDRIVELLRVMDQI